MYPVEVIPSKVWKHKITGSTASIYGACPASYAPGDTAQDWEIVQVGWTVRNDNGTIGVGKRPWPTKEAAELYLKMNQRKVS